MEEFVPGPENTQTLRAALGAFPTGVTVITAPSDIGPLGITANSFASVSLDPPLVLWSPARASLRFAAFAKASHFAVHVLGADQMHVCQQFTRIGHDFTGLDMRENDHGVPLIGGCPTRLECETVAQHDGGDHLIVIARVARVCVSDALPLVFSRGRYGAFDVDGLPDEDG